jgi:hypothetical protein
LFTNRYRLLIGGGFECRFNFCVAFQPDEVYRVFKTLGANQDAVFSTGEFKLNRELPASMSFTYTSAPSGSAVTATLKRRVSESSSGRSVPNPIRSRPDQTG